MFRRFKKWVESFYTTEYHFNVNLPCIPEALREAHARLECELRKLEECESVRDISAGVAKFQFGNVWVGEECDTAAVAVQRKAVDAAAAELARQVARATEGDHAGD